MRKNLFTLFVCALVSLSSWADDSDKNVRVIKLTGQKLKTDSSNVTQYPRFVFGDILLSTSDDEFYGADIRNNEWGESELIPKIGSFDGIVGPHLAKGPDRSFIRLETMIMGGDLKKLIIIPNTSSISAFKDESTWKTYDLNGLPRMQYCTNSVVLLSDSTMLLPAFIDNVKTIFATVDFKNKKFIPVDYWPNDGVDSVSDHAKSKFYTMNCILEVNGKGHFFYKADNSKDAFIFTLDNNKANIVKQLHVDHPQYDAPDGYNFRLGEIITTEKYESATNSQHIAMLYEDADKSGAKISLRKKRFPFYFGNIVELYDWDGNRKHTLYLDHYGQRIILSDDSRKLYLTWCDDHGENPHVWVYDLTNLDKQPQANLAELEKNRIVKEEDLQTPQADDNPNKVIPVKEGEMMVDFELFDFDDKPHHLNEFLGKGKYTILEFSSLSCGPCQLAKPTLEKFYDEHKDRFEMITISSDMIKPWKMQESKVSWHEWNDHKRAKEIGRKYDIKGLPTFFIISPEGKIERKCPALGGFFNALSDYITPEELNDLKHFFVENMKSVMGR